MPKRKRKSKKGSKDEPQELVQAPHSFVIRKGDVGKHVDQLMHDFRAVMEPFTASNLKMRKKNVVKDFVALSAYLNVTHMAIFTQTTKSPYFRLCRLPRGPTITYRIAAYTLTHDVIASMRKPHINSSLFHAAPLLVLNGFTAGNEEDIKSKLMTSMWRNMFPTIDIQKVQLSKIKRCVLLNLDAESGAIEFRHYAIKLKPVGLCNAVRKLMTGKRVPDLGRFTCVEEAIERAETAAFTESEGEADERDEARHVTLPQKFNSRGNMQNEKSSIRLIELGPRMKLELVKIEEGIMCGEVLHHSFVTKSRDEIAHLKREAERKASLKLARKQQQEENVRRKMAEKEKKTNKRQKVDLDSSGRNQKQNEAEKVGKSKKMLQKVYDAKVDDEQEQDADNENDDDDDDDDYGGNFSDFQISDDEMIPLDDA